MIEALAGADIEPDWVAGISIGAINAAIVAGNPPERRVERLEAFWNRVTSGLPSSSAMASTRRDLPHPVGPLSKSGNRFSYANRKTSRSRPTLR